MVDKRSREYLKTAKPAPVTNTPDDKLDTRAANRRKLRDVIKRLNWRSFRKYFEARAGLSFKRRLMLMNGVMGKNK